MMNATTDSISQLIVGIVLAGVFVLLARETAHRVLIALSAVALLLSVSYLTSYHLLSFESASRVVDMNVLVLLAAMMALVGVLKATGVFETAVSYILVRAKGRPIVVLVLIVWFTAFTSAFLDNVTTVIFVTPIALSVTRQLVLPPAAILLPMVMASNIGGTATLIGDPPNIMIGSAGQLSFLDFLLDLSLPCVLMIFWLEWYARHVYGGDFARSTAEGRVESLPRPLTDPRLGRWMAVVCVAVLVGFLTHHLTGMPPAVPALIGAAAALVGEDILSIRGNHPGERKTLYGVRRMTEADIEWPTLIFFALLFMIVGAAVETGLIERLAHFLEWMIHFGSRLFGGGDFGALLIAALLICWVSAVASAFIDNIPFVAVALPIVAHLIESMPGESKVLWWALSLGACLGGNGTAIGASANVTMIGIAERSGGHVSFGNFSRFGAPVALGTLIISSIYLLTFICLGGSGSQLVFLILVLLCGLWRIRYKRPVPG